MANLLTPDTADFEGGTLGDWSVDAARSSTSVATNSTAQAYSGTHSLKIARNSGTGVFTYVIQMSDVVSGVDVWNIAKTFPLDDTKTYDFEFSVFTPSGGFFSLHCACFDSGFSFLNYKLVNQGPTSTSGWYNLVGSWTPLAGSVYGALRFAANGSFGPAIYVDGFRFEEHVVPPPPGGWGMGQIRMGPN